MKLIKKIALDYSGVFARIDAKIRGKNHRHQRTFQLNYAWQGSFLVWYSFHLKLPLF
jgi:hypothetical protein